MSGPTLVVLAAGMGSRYGGVKQIDSVGPSGEAIIDYSVYDAIEAGFEHVVFVIRSEIEADVREFFGHSFNKRIQVSYVHQRFDDVPEGFVVPRERVKPWGTAHAMLAAREVVETPFVVINADDFYGRDAYVLLADYLTAETAAPTDYAMVAYRLDQTLSDNGTVSRGIVSVGSDDWLDKIEEHTKLRPENGRVASYDDDQSVKAWFTGSEPTSMNTFGFFPAAMEQFAEEFAQFVNEHGDDPRAEFYIPYAMDRLQRAGKARMKVLEGGKEWFGVTYREDRPRVVVRIGDLVARGAYPAKLWP